MSAHNLHIFDMLAEELASTLEMDGECCTCRGGFQGVREEVEESRLFGWWVGGEERGDVFEGCFV